MALQVCKKFIKSMGDFGPHLYRSISRNSRKRSAPTEPDVVEYAEGFRTTYKQPSKHRKTVDICQDRDMVENHDWQLQNTHIEADNAYQTLEKALSKSTKANIEKEKALLLLQTTNAEMEVALHEATRANAEKESELQTIRQEKQAAIDVCRKIVEEIQVERERTRTVAAERDSLASHIHDQLQPLIKQLRDVRQGIEGELSQLQQTVGTLLEERADVLETARSRVTNKKHSVPMARSRQEGVYDMFGVRMSK